MNEIAPGIWRWTTRHPEWHTKIEWGHEVASFALVAPGKAALAGGGALSLVDPLLPAPGSDTRAEVDRALERLVREASQLDIMITIPYHTRSAQSLFERYSGRRPTLLWGHALVQKRLTGTVPLEVIPRRAAGEAAAIAAGAAAAYTIGKPRRSEYPLYFP